MAWKRYLGALKTSSDAAIKALDTAKAVLKKELDSIAPIKTAQTAFVKAIEANEIDQLKTTREDLLKALEPVSKVADANPDLKANDAFLRLLEAYEVTRKNADNALKDYFTGMDIYNDRIQRLPYCLVSFGFGFLKGEPLVQPEQ